MDSDETTGDGRLLIKSKQRVQDHGEVFTPVVMVDAMLNLVREESYRTDSRFLEPACGDGTFLVRVLQRKFVTVTQKYRRSIFDQHHFALHGLMCLYGIELLEDNVQLCRAKLLSTLCDQFEVDETHVMYQAAVAVLEANIVHGDALAMKTATNKSIEFAEWGYLGRGKYQRRDFRYDRLTGMSCYTDNGSLFASLGHDEIFTPTRSYPTMMMTDIVRISQDYRNE